MNLDPSCFGFSVDASVLRERFTAFIAQNCKTVLLLVESVVVIRKKLQNKVG